MPAPVFRDPKHGIRIYHGDCLEILAAIPPETVDLVFADPPYFLSNDGITCHAGRMVSVNKGDWDRSRGPDTNHEFNRAWLAASNYKSCETWTSLNSWVVESTACGKSAVHTVNRQRSGFAVLSGPCRGDLDPLQDSRSATRRTTGR